jgi:hypothetical protein
VRERRLGGLVVAHLMAVVAEWAVTVGVLVHAYAWGGPTAVGIVSLAVLAPPFLGGPIAAAATSRRRPMRVRLAGFVVQAVAYGGAAVAAELDAPSPVVAGFVVVGLVALCTLRPTEAVVLPQLARTTRDLVTANLRISYCDSASALIGPLAAAVLAGLGGPTMVFAGAAAGMVIAIGTTAWRMGSTDIRSVPAPARTENEPRRRHVRTAITELRARPWSIGVLCVASARNLVIGAFDVLLVIIAIEHLDLGDGGPGLLSALVGGGALLSVVVTTVVVRRSRLGPALAVALLITTALCVVLAVDLGTVLVMATLPILGICLSSMDNLGRILLQRSTDPRNLGPLFAFVGVIAAAAQIVGSGIAQALLAVAGAQAALVGLGAVLVTITVTSRRSLRAADDHADVPVVEMSMLVGLPMFAPLSTGGLEAVARAVSRIDVPAGAEIIRQGHEGDVFYVVSDGDFDVVMSGEHIRTARRGDFFGEVALLAGVPRTATVTTATGGSLLAIHRNPFLVAIGGHDLSHAIATDHVRGLRLDTDAELRFAPRHDGADPDAR